MKVTNTTKFICILLASAILVSSCASTTLFQTTPTYATVYVSEQKVGTTPYKYTDRKIAGSSTSVTIKKDGYKDLYILLKRNELLHVGALIGGIMFLYPLLWLKKYNPVHIYDLEKLADNAQAVTAYEKSNYLMGEDDLIKITIDSVKRSVSLPESINNDLDNVGRAENNARITLKEQRLNVKNGYPSYYAGLKSGNDYFFVYFTLIKKSDFSYNLSNKWPTNVGGITTFSRSGIWAENYITGLECFPTCYLKDEFGKLQSALIYRSSDQITFSGGILSWNPDTFNDRPNPENEFLIFQLPKDEKPLQIVFYYQYRDESQKNAQMKSGQIDIVLKPQN